MTLPEVLIMLVDRIDAAGGRAAWCASTGVSPGYLGDVLHGRRDPGEKLLAALGLRKVVDYVRLNPEGEGDGASRRQVDEGQGG